jgi:hypothetical protein
MPVSDELDQEPLESGPDHLDPAAVSLGGLLQEEARDYQHALSRARAGHSRPLGGWRGKRAQPWDSLREVVSEEIQPEDDAEIRRPGSGCMPPVWFPHRGEENVSRRAWEDCVTEHQVHSAADHYPDLHAFVVVHVEAWLERQGTTTNIHHTVCRRDALVVCRAEVIPRMLSYARKLG